MSEAVLELPRKKSTGNDHYDNYPSRKGDSESFITRNDPIVYAPNSESPPIGRDLVDNYEQQGFLVLDNVFTEEEIAGFKSESETLRSPGANVNPSEIVTELSDSDVRSVFRVHERSDVFKALSADKRLIELARYLLNDDVYIHQSRVNYKPGFRGKEFYWHSDFETWHVEDGMPRMRALSMLITLTPNHDQNGPLMLIPGSHKTYVSCEGITPENNYRRSLKKQELGAPSDKSLFALVSDGSVVAATSKPGSVIIFDCNVMHGSNGNITPFPRSNVFFVYNAVSNRVEQPFSKQPPRPEHLCTRKNIQPIT